MNAVKTIEPVADSAATTSPNQPAAGGRTRNAEPIHAQDIGKEAWPAFCRWMTANLCGMVTNIVREEHDSGTVVECLERALKSIDAVVLPNGVNAIHITVSMNGKVHVFEVAGPCWLRMHYDAAGFLMRVEIGYQEGKLILGFSGSPAPGTVFTANSWGE